jgi:hypothetical protein
LLKLIRPMLATLVPKPFHRKGWVYEEKYDGVRALAYRRRRVRLYTRNLNDITAEYREIGVALESLGRDPFVLDGEIVAFDRRRVSRFQLLQRRAQGERIQPVFAIFDCLERDGVSLLRRSLAERRRALEAIVSARRGDLMRARRLPPDGFAAYRRAQKRSWEGIVGKDAASLYEPGRRTRSWLKVKCRKEAEFVIGGFTAPRRPLQRSRSPIRREGRDRILRENAGRARRPDASAPDSRIAVSPGSPRSGYHLDPPQAGGADRLRRVDGRRQAPPAGVSRPSPRQEALGVHLEDP